MNYKIVKSAGKDLNVALESLVEAVDLHLQEGWIPTGGVSVEGVTIGEGMHIFTTIIICQALIKSQR